MLKGQDANPFESIGKKAEVLTLSKGKYVEIFENDSIHRVGCVLINMNTKTIVGFLDEDSLQQVAADNSEHSRWYQQDPMMEEYYDYSPYNYTLNNPVNYTDPDGMLVVDKGDRYVITGDDIFSYFGYLKTVSSGQGSMDNLYQGLAFASSQNEGAGGDMTATLGGVTAIGLGNRQTLTVPGSPDDPGFLRNTITTRPTREPYTGVFGTLDYIWNGGNYRGIRYDMSGNPIGRAPNMGLPPDVSIGKIAGITSTFKAIEGARGNLLRAAENAKLRNIINDLFRRGAKVGGGSSMDAYRLEQLTGGTVGGKTHGTKLLQYRTALQRLWNNRTNLSATDKQIVKELLTDIQNALSGN